MSATGNLQDNDIPSIVGPTHDSGGSVFMEAAGGGQPMNHMSSAPGPAHPGSSVPMAILNPSSTNHGHHHHHNHHGSLRDQIVVGSSGSATQIHTIRSSQSNSGNAGNGSFLIEGMLECNQTRAPPYYEVPYARDY